MRQNKGYIPPDFIQALVARADIVALINTRIPLKRSGQNFMACCPFHNEKTPSFSVSPTRQMYHCFGCGASGSIVNFLINYENLEFKEAIEALAAIEGVEIPYERGQHYNPQQAQKYEDLLNVLEKAAEFYQTQLRTHPDKDLVVTYLKTREISGEIAQQFALGYAPTGWQNLKNHLNQLGFKDDLLLEAGLLSESSQQPQNNPQNNKKNNYDRFRGRLIFPIRNRRGATIGFGGRVIKEDEQPKYLNSPETPVFHKGAEIYGLYELRKYTRHYEAIIVVEGYMDVVKLAQYGVKNAVATLGTAINSQQIKTLLRYSKALIFAFDGDQAGARAAKKALEETLPVLAAGKEVGFLFFPEGEDPDSFIEQQGVVAFNERMANSVPLSRYLLETLKESHPLTSLEGQAEFLQAFANYTNKMPPSPLKDLLIEEGRKKARLSEAVLGKHIPEIRGRLQNKTASRASYRGGRQGSQAAPISPITFHQETTLTDRLVILLLNHPEIAHSVRLAPFLLNSEKEELSRLYYILSQLQDLPQITNMAQALLSFREEPWFPWLERLSRTQLLLQDKEALTKEFIHLLAQLEKQESPFNKVLAKLRQGQPLTAEEKKVLQKGQ